MTEIMEQLTNKSIHSMEHYMQIPLPIPPGLETQNLYHRIDHLEALLVCKPPQHLEPSVEKVMNVLPTLPKIEPDAELTPLKHRIAGETVPVGRKSINLDVFDDDTEEHIDTAKYQTEHSFSTSYQTTNEHLSTTIDATKDSHKVCTTMRTSTEFSAMLRTTTRSRT